MTLKEALEIICNETIPKEINGVRTKYIIRNDVTKLLADYKVIIFPSDITKDNLSFCYSFNDETWAVGYPIERGTLSWECLSEKIQELLITYIKKIIEYFDGKVIATRVVTVNPFNKEENK